jgi:hypothetical protein
MTKPFRSCAGAAEHIDFCRERGYYHRGVFRYPTCAPRAPEEHERREVLDERNPFLPHELDEKRIKAFAINQHDEVRSFLQQQFFLRALGFANRAAETSRTVKSNVAEVRTIDPHVDTGGAQTFSTAAVKVDVWVRAPKSPREMCRLHVAGDFSRSEENAWPMGGWIHVVVTAPAAVWSRL